MVLELEKFYELVMYPANKKSYMNIDRKGKFTIKGVPFNCYTLEYRSELELFFKGNLLNAEIAPLVQCDTYKQQIQAHII